MRASPLGAQDRLGAPFNTPALVFAARLAPKPKACTGVAVPGCAAAFQERSTAAGLRGLVAIWGASPLGRGWTLVELGIEPVSFAARSGAKTGRGWSSASLRKFGVGPRLASRFSRLPVAPAGGLRPVHWGPAKGAGHRRDAPARQQHSATITRRAWRGAPNRGGGSGGSRFRTRGGGGRRRRGRRRRSSRASRWACSAGRSWSASGRRSP